MELFCKNSERLSAIFQKSFITDRPWDQTNFVLNLTEKVKPSYLLSLMCMFPESNGNSGKFRYFTDQKGPKRGPHENEFWHFSNTKMNITDC